MSPRAWYTLLSPSPVCFSTSLLRSLLGNLRPVARMAGDRLPVLRTFAGGGKHGSRVLLRQVVDQRSRAKERCLYVLINWTDLPVIPAGVGKDHLACRGETGPGQGHREISGQENAPQDQVACPSTSPVRCRPNWRKNRHTMWVPWAWALEDRWGSLLRHRMVHSEDQDTLPF
jgi:hypothetical protein